MQLEGRLAVALLLEGRQAQRSESKKRRVESRWRSAVGYCYCIVLIDAEEMLYGLAHRSEDQIWVISLGLARV